MVDDLNMEGGNVDIAEFLRAWGQSGGYFDVKLGVFKTAGDYVGVVVGDKKWERCHGTTVYLDEYEQDKQKIFVQYWLTSKMWCTSTLVNKYYILITNAVMNLLEKVKRQEIFHNSQLTRLTNFHFLSRLCQNLVNFTSISDEP